MQVTFVQSKKSDEKVIVLGVFKNHKLTKSAKLLDAETNGFIQKVISLNESIFKGDEGDIISALWPSVSGYKNFILLGIGSEKEQSLEGWQEIGAALSLRLKTEKAKKVFIDIADDKIKNDAEAKAYLISGIELKLWSFDRYKTKKEDTFAINEISCTSINPSLSERTFRELEHISKGVFLTREVVSEPPNVLYPETMANIALELKKIGLSVEIFNKKDLIKKGMNAILAVGQGSVNDPRFVVLRWENAPKDKAPIAFVGKGVTFDSGGISIKPSSGMELMKYDMAGAGVVLGLMKTLALRKAPINAIGILSLAENMPSGTAQRPADVVKSLSCKTIEIVNTDAEGRLVLADALWYAQEAFNPRYIIDLATLTGAIVVALGEEYAGLFSNDDTLANALTTAGKNVKEHLWRFPMDDAYDKDIDSDIADVKNVGSGRGAGSITAAHFLKRFIKDGTSWAHIDIAGVVWNKKSRKLSEKGATGFGVRILNEFVKNVCE
ncbi:MAG: leucyl aminopeptidase [Alphaproteobacteria bacterium]